MQLFSLLSTASGMKIKTLKESSGDNMLEANGIKKEISQVQETINNLLNIENLNSETVLSLSQKLDKLIAAFMKCS